MIEVIQQPERVKIAYGSRRDFFSRLDRFLARYYRPKTVTLALKQPIVSFSFDDIPCSAITNGARILENHGKRGSFYIAGKLCGRQSRNDTFADQNALTDLIKSGHEIGCHTFSHADIQRLSTSKLQTEFAKNQAFLSKIDPKWVCVSHAYPYGSVGLLQKLAASHQFSVCRGVRPGLNKKKIDLAQLRAVPLYDSVYSDEDIAGIIDQAVKQAAWLIFYTHDVSAAPSNQGTSNRLLEFALSRSIEAGCKIETIAESLKSIRNRPIPTGVDNVRF